VLGTLLAFELMATIFSAEVLRLVIRLTTQITFQSGTPS
jgi:hypothetical protein